MKFFSYICNCVALDTGMCGFSQNWAFGDRSPKNATFANSEGE